jgi:murein DD-endopeptidase MepM/ murein hydrolase activator NlpD
MGNHRAERRGPKRAAADPPRSPEPKARTTRATGTRAAAGRRRATRGRPSSPGFLPSVPTVVGAVAIIAAASGAVAFGQGRVPASENITLSSSGSDALNGTDAFGFGGDAREAAISRDTERQAQEDKADDKLQAAIEEQSQQRNAALASLAASAEKRADQIARNLWVLPTIGYHLTARFGQVGLWSSIHTGLDFAAPSGTPIFAVANGVVTEAGYDGSYGNKTVETLPDGTEIWYCHQSTIGVSVGDKVVQSDQIGTVGSTGHVTGPHVHIEVRPGGGDPVDPYPEFLLHGVTP